MTDIHTKFSVGDVVYHAWTTTVAKQHPCPDCLGSRNWKALSPAGGEYTFACPRCSSSYQRDRDLSLTYHEHEPFARRLTIGSVRFDSANGEDRRFEYMCAETGVGSGSVYSEVDLFPTEDEALRAAEIKAKELNTTVGWIVSQYDKSLSLSDYKIDSAALKSARDMKIRHGTDLQILFGDLRECETIEAVAEVLNSFKFRDE